MVTQVCNNLIKMQSSVLKSKYHININKKMTIYGIFSTLSKHYINDF